MINPQWLELSMSRTNFYRPKDVQDIEVGLYVTESAEELAHTDLYSSQKTWSPVYMT